MEEQPNCVDCDPQTINRIIKNKNMRQGKDGNQTISGHQMSFCDKARDYFKQFIKNTKIY